jgi:hypothetical protein
MKKAYRKPSMTALGLLRSITKMAMSVSCSCGDK